MLPKVFRSNDIFTVMLVSSTKLSGQIASIRTSRFTRCPRFSSKYSKMSNALGAKGTEV